MEFFNWNFFGLLPKVFNHSNSKLESKVTLVLQIKIAKFKLGYPKKVLHECSSALELLLIK